MKILSKTQKEIIEKFQNNFDKLTYAQQIILEQIYIKCNTHTIDNESDFQDLHWDDVYSVYYDNIGK